MLISFHIFFTLFICIKSSEMLRMGFTSRVVEAIIKTTAKIIIELSNQRNLSSPNFTSERKNASKKDVFRRKN